MTTYNPSIPIVSDNLATSCPQMQTNFSQANTIFASDHYPFDYVTSTSRGQHKQITFPLRTAPGAQTDPASVIYTAIGTATTAPALAGSQLFYRTQNGVFHLSPIKAWAYCSGTVANPGNSILANQFSNVTTVVRASEGQYDVTIPANILASNNYSVILSVSQASTGASGDQLSITYTSLTPTSFHISVVNVARGAVVDPTSFSFMVIQI